MDEYFCNDCGEEFRATDPEECPNCGSEEIELIYDEDDWDKEDDWDEEDDE